MKQWKKTLIDMIARVDSGKINDRAWIRCGPLKSYLRVTIRLLDGKKKKTIDIASVDVLSKERKRGVFSSWLKEVENIAQKHNRAVYVENVLNKELEGYLIRMGYSPHGIEEQKSYYKFLA